MARAKWIVGIALSAVVSGCGPEPTVRAESPPPAVTASPAAEPATPAEAAASHQDPWRPSAPLRDWEFIVLHHTATDEGDVATIHREHQKRKDSGGTPWRGIGYHFLIGNGKGMKDGEVEPTFRWQEQSDGAHAGSLKHNQRGIGICLVGNFNKRAPTRKQMASLKRLLEWLQQEMGIPEARVLKHSDIKVTDCPGKKFRLP